jgi:hypothetical protein
MSSIYDSNVQNSIVEYFRQRPSWRFDFENGETRTEVFALHDGTWVYVKHDRVTQRSHEIREGDQKHPFDQYHTMREALTALGWEEDQEIAFWNYVPPSVQWDWEDMTEDEFLDNAITYSPAPIIRVL